MSEKDVEKYLRDRVRETGGMSWKWVSPQQLGVPDRIVIYPYNTICFVETKAPGKKERLSQVIAQNKLRSMGCAVFSSVDSKEKVESLITWCRLMSIRNKHFAKAGEEHGSDGDL